MTNIILLGPPGSGKGTQAKLLVDEKNFFQLSTGDILRSSLKSSSPDGEKIKKIMENGQLVPDDLVIKIIIESINLMKNKNIIFDGFPRNLIQAKELDKALEHKQTQVDYVILLDVKFSELEKRIKKRILESSENNVRDDDNLETLNKRLKVYKESTEPIINFYKSKNRFHRIDGMLEIEQISEKINMLIN
tara:strand:- start:636 stop:1208 length:573 start_codon:yes stop_codon:yes gene_type:complete